MHPLYHNQRYYSLNQYYQKIFGCRVMKAVVDGGFSCPNKDGTLSTRGCVFCHNGSGYFTGKGSVTQQIAKERERIHQKYADAKLIAYFQANTNTYAPIEVLKERYEEAIACEDVIGLSIATRGDCIENDTMEYLKELSKKIWLSVEIGVQTMHQQTADNMNLCCSREKIESCVKELKANGIRVCLHIINGLPGETKEMMLNTVQQVSRWHPDGIKIQLLHVIEHTELAKWYEQNQFQTMTEEEYVELTALQIAHLPHDTVCERLTGDGDAETLIAPLWSKNKRRVLNQIAHKMKEKGLFQGDLFS